MMEVGRAMGAAAGEIEWCSPLALTPGASTEITFHGDRLRGLTNFWSSFPCTVEFLKSSDKETVLRVTVRSNLPVQIGAVRLAGSNALSSLELLMVDDLPSVAKTNASRNSPQRLASGTAVNGAIAELQADYFSFTAKRKESVSIEVLAHRLGSALDPLLRVLDGKGTELVYSLAANEPNGDPKIRFTAPEDGNYTIELRDVSYRGGNSYFYRMRLGRWPIVTAPFPAVAKRGNWPALELTGPSINRARVSLDTNTTSNGQEPGVPVSARFARIPGSGFTELLLSELPQTTEKEPNDQPAEATRVSLPTGVNGRFEKPGDKDYYEFEARKGDRIACMARTRSLGVPCDVSLQLFDEENKQVAESKNTGADEGLLSTRIEKSGVHRLLVEELTGAGRADFVYHVSVEKDAPGFHLQIGEDRAQVSSNGLFTVDVSCNRDGYDGPVTLRVNGLNDCRIDNGTIPAKQTNVVLAFSLPEVEKGKLLCFRVTGEKTNASATVAASTLPALRKDFPNLLYPPEQINGWIWIPPFAQSGSSKPKRGGK